MGYPSSFDNSESQNCVASPLSNDNCAGSQYLGIGEIVRTTSLHVAYYIDTLEGMSGAPVYKTEGDQHDIAAVNNRHNTTSVCENQAVRMNSSKINWVNGIASNNPPTPACP